MACLIFATIRAILGCINNEGTSAMSVYAVITGTRKFDLELQIVCETKALATKEVKELKRDYGMEDARVKEFADESAAYDWIEKNS